MNRTLIFKLGLVFVLAFLLNWPWEILHSYLYTSYKSAPITQTILFLAAFGDALRITPLFLIAELVKKHKTTIVVGGGFLIAIANELYALATHRWAYNALMPLIPFLHIGLTPTIELAVTGYLIQKFIETKTG